MSEQKELAVFTTVEKDNLNKFVTETQVALNGFDQTLYRLIIAVEALRANLFDKGVITEEEYTKVVGEVVKTTQEQLSKLTEEELKQLAKVSDPTEETPSE